jgi:mannose-6-phosphate isomerase-like protein (cupin superfamily)
MQTVNLADKFARFSDHWSPKLVGQVNGCAIKLVKLSGEFVWHHHDTEDEMFFVVKGRLRMKFRNGEQVVNPGEFIIVPHGVEHLPVAEGETEIMLVEPDTTLNTGNVVNERTVADLQHI